LKDWYSYIPSKYFDFVFPIKVKIRQEKSVRLVMTGQPFSTLLFVLLLSHHLPEENPFISIFGWRI